MNERQRIVVLFGIFFLVVLYLFPPYVIQYSNVSIFGGHHFLLYQPDTDEYLDCSLHFKIVNANDFKNVHYRIDLIRLFIETFVVIIIHLLIFLICSKKCKFLNLTTGFLRLSLWLLPFVFFIAIIESGDVYDTTMELMLSSFIISLIPLIIFLLIRYVIFWIIKNISNGFYKK